MRQDLSTDVRGRHVLIVEDIIDSGVTLAWLVDELKAVVPLPWRFLRCWKSRRAVRWMFL